MNKIKIEYIRAETDRHLAIAQELFLEYARSLGFDLCFQDFDGELANISEHYGPPGGCILLAFYEDRPAGCVALRGLETGICEMKRLYVRPAFRGSGIGRTLSEMIIIEAGKIGYEKMRLDTLESMTEAISIYRMLGFYEIGAYRYNPLQNALFLEKEI